MADEKFWIEQTADAVEAFVDAKTVPPEVIVCASGVSPSGPIHLGNMREVMTVHLVAEELKRRGRKAEHIHSWDDYDRFRKVPAGLSAEYADYIGLPLASVPDPEGEYPSYADRYIAEFQESARRLGIEPRYVRQSVAYPRGDYLEGIRVAMKRRAEIFDMLAKHQTAGRHTEDIDVRRAAYYPFKPYCSACGKDFTTVESYDEDTATLSYSCACGHRETYSLHERIGGKLVWKVDWPMRWAHENVTFEPGGEDHAAPGSSYTVGKEIVRLFGFEAPHFIPYTFVGMAGRSKISGSAGGSPTPAQALDILEPVMLRWLYVRRHYAKRFDVDFGVEVIRLYDEWDSFYSRVESDLATPAEALVRERCLKTSAGPVARTRHRMPFRMLSSAADITLGNREQILAVARAHFENKVFAESDFEPRLTCAINWATRYVPEDERTHVRASYSKEAFDALSSEQREQVKTLLLELSSNDSWSAEGLTALLYRIPKHAAGVSIDSKPTPEVKEMQREFFITLYRLLLVDSDTGPRLPTFFLSLGRKRVLELLAPGFSEPNTNIH